MTINILRLNYNDFVCFLSLCHTFCPHLVLLGVPDRSPAGWRAGGGSPFRMCAPDLIRLVPRSRFPYASTGPAPGRWAPHQLIRACASMRCRGGGSQHNETPQARGGALITNKCTSKPLMLIFSYVSLLFGKRYMFFHNCIDF